MYDVMLWMYDKLTTLVISDTSIAALERFKVVVLEYSQRNDRIWNCVQSTRCGCIIANDAIYWVLTRTASYAVLYGNRLSK